MNDSLESLFKKFLRILNLANINLQKIMKKYFIEPFND